jgi:branched-subunit amino acid aminotransferase/4-amino-4-deoxychorismate lyase
VRGAENGHCRACDAPKEHKALQAGRSLVTSPDSPAGDNDARLKGQALDAPPPDLGLIETFRWSVDAGFVRLSRHLDRLSTSATLLGFAFDRPSAEQALEHCTRNWTHVPASDRRVRILLRSTGVLAIEHAPAPPADSKPPLVGFAKVTLNASDPLLRHKTTRRGTYEAAAGTAKTAGWADALILNQSGGVADGSHHSVFASIGGRLITPPLTAGALAGVLRGERIDRGDAIEAELTPDDLEAAGDLFIGNSLRGLRKVILQTTTRV